VTTTTGGGGGGGGGGGDDSTKAIELVLGVDTHLHIHVAVALDQLGRRLGELALPTTIKGYETLICWAKGFGSIKCAGIEGTSSYGAGLARHLREAGIVVMEVERPKRRGTCAATASLTQEKTPRAPPGRCWPLRRPESPKAQTRPRGDDPSLESRPPFCGESPRPGGRQPPAPGPAGDGT